MNTTINTTVIDFIGNASTANDETGRANGVLYSSLRRLAQINADLLNITESISREMDRVATAVDGYTHMSISPIAHTATELDRALTKRSEQIELVRMLCFTLGYDATDVFTEMMARTW